MNLNRFFAAAIVVAAAMAAPAAALAVKAYPGVIMASQPDGSVLPVLKRGDQWANYTTTAGADGGANYLLLPDAQGALCYASLDAAGRVVNTGVRATANPTAAELDARRAIDPRAVIERHVEGLQAAATLRREAYGRLHPRRFAMPATAAGAQQRIPSNMLTTNFPSHGKQRAIVILVQYTDVKFNLADPAAYFNGMLNTDNFAEYGATGSVHQYFLETSGGRFDCDFDVFGPITLPRNRAYYGGNNSVTGQDMNPEYMVIHACQELDATVDFSQYDRDGDGIVDNVFVFYAGTGEATSGNANDVWPHSYDVRNVGTYRFDGVTLGNYACTNEWIAYDGNPRPDGIGTFCHEFSHVMGLPDLYCTNDYLSPFTPGDWTILDNGPYMNDGRTPPHYSAFERLSMGWIEPRFITERGNYELKPLGSDNECYVIATASDNEFFVLENRQKVGQDRYLPGHGMLIWHIDYLASAWRNNTVNNTNNASAAEHQRVDLVEANNQSRATTSSLTGRPGNPFPGTRKRTEFSTETEPAFVNWRGQDVGYPLTDIAESADGLITFKVLGGYTFIDAVKAQAATDVTPRSFKARWSKSAEATDYELTVTPAGSSTPLKAWNHRLTGDVDNFTVDGLEPSTAYTFTVRCAGDNYTSDESNAVAVTTGELTFDFVIPVARPATAISATGFTAQWDAVEGATAYLLDVYSKAYSEVRSETADMVNGLAGLPKGWETTATKTYNSAAYAGESGAPSLRMGRGEDITTPSLPGYITGYSFAARCAMQSAEKNSIVVEALVGGQWQQIATLSPAYSGMTKYTEDKMTVNATALRVSYVGTASGDLAIDDITVSYGINQVEVPLAGYSALNVGNVTSRAVGGLAAGTDYFYRVRATNGTLTSLSSAEVPVLEGWSGIGDIIGDESAAFDPSAPYELYNMQGVRVSGNPAPGIYLRRQGSRVDKVMVR